jgi:hypothetical protein
MEGNQTLMKDWQFEDDFAAANGISKRQVARLRKKVNGLPFAVLGKRIVIHTPTAQRWLMDRLVVPNPTRGGRR